MKAKILHVVGSRISFKCEECGCNVFIEISKGKFRCNGCLAIYAAIKEQK